MGFFLREGVEGPSGLLVAGGLLSWIRLVPLPIRSWVSRARVLGNPQAETQKKVFMSFANLQGLEQAGGPRLSG